MIHLLSKSFGSYQTNCYVVQTPCGDFIIDPGYQALEWLQKVVKKPKAIFNTHGHFDHIWDNAKVAETFSIEIYCPKDDVFMLQKDPLGMLQNPSRTDISVERDAKFIFDDDLHITFHYFPGHTPGCSAIEFVLDDHKMLFSGDFIFQGSIGRVDFPYSSPELMLQSIYKILNWENDIDIFPGHGLPTKLSKERENLARWIKYLC